MTTELEKKEEKSPEELCAESLEQLAQQLRAGEISVSEFSYDMPYKAVGGKWGRKEYVPTGETVLRVMFVHKPDPKEKESA